MPLPIQTRNVEIAVVAPPEGVAGVGTVTFWLPGPIRDNNGNVVLAKGSFVATLDDNGEDVIALPVNDQAGTSPTGWSYAVEVRVGDWSTRGALAVPSGVGSIAFADAFTDGAELTPGSTYATVGALAVEAAARVAADAAHAADTTAVHGIADTGDLVTTGDLLPYATTAQLAAHDADTTAVHGIADTTQLATAAQVAAAIAALSTVYAALAGAVFVGDVTIEDTGVKGYRLRRSGSGLDLDGSGADLFLSIFEEPGFAGDQHVYLRLEKDAHIAHPVGRWLFGSSPFGGEVLDVDPAGPGLGFFGTAAQPKPTVTGSTGGNAALESLIAALADIGLINDGT